MRTRWLLPLIALSAGCPKDDTDGNDDTDTDIGDVTPECPEGDAADMDFAIDLEADERGMFMSVWGPSEDEVYVVGGEQEEGLLLKGTAGSWDVVDLPGDPTMLNWVTGTSEDDVWVGGRDGTVFQWDGSTWTDRSFEQDGAIWGMAARAPDDVLAVGGVWFSEGTPFAQRWDGSTWTAVELPDDLPATNTLFKTTATADGYVVVGASGASFEVTDAGATTLANPVTEDMVTVHAGPDGTVVAVGGASTGRLWTLGDSGWEASATSFTKLNGVHVHKADEIAFVGDRGAWGLWDGAAELADEQIPVAFELLHGVWVGPCGTVYAAGGNAFSGGDDWAGTLLVSSSALE